MIVRLAPVLQLLLLVLVSCDRHPAPAPTTMTAEPEFQLDLKPLTPLLPNRPTHLAIDTLGNVYWAQETDRQDDTLFIIGEGDIPRATQLSAASISDALGTPGGRGNIHGIASGPGGELYFYFHGAKGRESLNCLGRFFPKTGGIQILSDTKALAAATDMGLSLPLARGDVISDGRTVWLFVRHTDAYALFRIDPRKLPTAGPMPLSRAFDAVKLDSVPVDLAREELQLSTAPEGALFLLDPVAGRLLKISPDGAATFVRSLVGMPSALSSPTTDRTGRLLIFAGHGEPIPPANIEDASQAKPPDTSYPAMLIFGPRTITIARDDIMAYPGFPVFGLRLHTLIPSPVAEGWVTYDSGSGELLRLQIREKIFR